MKKRAVMTVKWDVGAPAGFRGDAPAPCWADCPPHSMLPPPVPCWSPLVQETLAVYTEAPLI